MRVVHPCHDYLLLRPVELGDQLTPGGLMIPEAVREQPTEGTVVAVGPKVPPEMSATRTLVLYRRFSAVEVEANGEQLLLVKAADIMAVLEGEHARPMVAMLADS